MTIIYKYAAQAFVIVMLIAYAGFFGYEKGRKIERVEWIEQNAKYQAAANAEKEKREAEIKKERVAYEENFMRVLNERQRLQADLNQRMHELRSGGLWIKSSSCPGSGRVSGETESSGGDDRPSGQGKIRLPRETERGVLEIGQDAAELVNKYNTLRGICLPLVEVID